MKLFHDAFSALPWIAVAGAAIALILRATGLPDQRARKLLLVLLGAAILFHGVIFLHTALAYVEFPYEQKSVVEGVTVYNAAKYLDGESSYRDPTKAPFRSMVYPPVHEMLLAPVMGILGGPSLIGGRIFSLLCALGTAVAAGAAIRRRTRNWRAATLGGLFFFCGYGLSLQWIEQVRNDALLCLLIVAGLLASERALVRKRFPAAGLALLILALYTKQTALFAALAVVATLWRSDRRRALVWAGSYAGTALLVFLLMQWWSRGWFAFYILRVPGGVGFNWVQLNHAVTFFVMALPATGFALWCSLRAARHPGKDEPPLWETAFLIALPVCLLQSVKWGATMNAFLPLLPLIGVVGAVGLHRRLSAKKPAPYGRLLLALALVQVGVLVYRPLLPDASHVESHRRIATWVRAAPGPVLVSGYSSHAYKNGKAYYGDPVIMGDIERAGLWRGNEAIAMTRRSEFALLVLRPKVEPAELAAAVESVYAPVDRIHFDNSIGGWPWMQVYVPASAPWQPAPD